jgi:hypothetical protein
MREATLAPLIVWETFYTIIGSAAAALTGLMFVVITLIAGNRVPRSNETVNAFGTPTVVHLGAALLIAAILSAPWPLLWNVSLMLALVGLAGIIYACVILFRALHQHVYEPVLEDWIWHTIIPFFSYLALAVAALVLLTNPTPALFAVGAVTLLFLFTGMHNAWDTVTYIIVANPQQKQEDQDS